MEKSIILELKAVNKLLPIHQSQLLTYLKLADLRLGLLLNFNVEARTVSGGLFVERWIPGKPAPTIQLRF